MERAAAAQPDWAWRPVSERAAALRRFAAAIEDDAAALSGLLVREVGKRRADADGEVAWTATSARFYAEHPPAEERAGDTRVVRRRIGVVAAITPWNVPLITPAWKWLPALVAGNAVLWKPSERATATALAAREQLHAAGVPEAILQVLPGDAATARALAAVAMVRAGVLAINRRGDDVAIEAPFGGRGRSGNGRPEGGEYAYGALTDLQAIYG